MIAYAALPKFAYSIAFAYRVRCTCLSLTTDAAWVHQCSNCTGCRTADGHILPKMTTSITGRMSNLSFDSSTSKPYHSFPPRLDGLTLDLHA